MQMLDRQRVQQAAADEAKKLVDAAVLAAERLDGNLVSLYVMLCEYVKEAVTSDDDDVFYLFLQKQKRGAELHIHLEEGTYHKPVLTV